MYGAPTFFIHLLMTTANKIGFYKKEYISTEEEKLMNIILLIIFTFSMYLLVSTACMTVE